MALLAAIALVAALFPRAMQASEYARVRSGEVRLVDGVYQVDARIEYRLSPAAREALDSGVALELLVEVEVERQRWWWWDETISRTVRRFRIQYHALSERYVLTAADTRDSRSFNDLGALLSAFGRVQGLPVIRASRLASDQNYRVRLRAGLDVDALPRPLRTVAYISPQWQLTSDWQSWSLES